jgi:hypothetical protein
MQRGQAAGWRSRVTQRGDATESHGAYCCRMRFRGWGQRASTRVQRPLRELCALGSLRPRRRASVAAAVNAKRRPRGGGGLRTDGVAARGCGRRGVPGALHGHAHTFRSLCKICLLWTCQSPRAIWTNLCREQEGRRPCAHALSKRVRAGPNCFCGCPWKPIDPSAAACTA